MVSGRRGLGLEPVVFGWGFGGDFNVVGKLKGVAFDDCGNLRNDIEFFGPWKGRLVEEAVVERMVGSRTDSTKLWPRET